MKISLGVKAIAVFSLIFLINFAGILIFLKGFLLSRTVVNATSSCKTDFALGAEDHPHHGNEGCWMHSRFKKAVIVIIDALKYDFLAYNTSLSKSPDVPPFKNKLKTIDLLMRNKPLNSRLYRFIADPPTTTMQRLKGLTTGSLPTFVDAGANFQSSEIEEDNFIDQIVSQSKRIQFFGDDTWLGLYPKRFFRTYDFPSFDVKDLDTVDNGILKNIFFKLKRSDWDVTIAHFLGVDHCGHRFGPNHPAMAKKLSQMDDFLKNITYMLDKDTVLFVMGDHGMTRTGDHGGDSLDELEAGLFVYSSSQIASTRQTDFKTNLVKQTDFVPTLSLLLGVPIPFSNLGMVIPELFSHCPWWDSQANDLRQTYHRVKALRLNAQQINSYLEAYQQLASDLPRNKLKELYEVVAEAEGVLQGRLTQMVAEGSQGDDARQLHQLEDSYKNYIQAARAMCETVWAKFDVKLIVVGLMTLAAGLAVAIYFFVTCVEEGEGELLSTGGQFLLGGCFIHLVYIGVHFTFLGESVPPLMAFVLSLIIIFGSCVLTKKYLATVISQFCSFNTAFNNVIGSTMILLQCCSFFSNSFVVYEDATSLFMLQTFILSLGIIVIAKNNHQTKESTIHIFVKSSKKSTSFDLLHSLTQPSSITICVVFVACFFLRLTSFFWACREEQVGCVESHFIPQLASVDDSSRNQRYLTSVVCLAAMIYGVRRWLEYYGNLNEASLSTLSVRYCLPLAVLFTAFHWAMQAIPQVALDHLSPAEQALMAQLVYILLIITLAMLIFSPLLLFKLPTRKDSHIQLATSNVNHAIPTIYNQLKVQLSHDDGDMEKPPVVYGLGSVYSASMVSLLATVSLLLALLLNDGVAPSLMLSTCSFFFGLHLYASVLTSQSSDPKKELSCGSIWSGVILLSLFSSVFFYATGHQATIPSIRFEAAFTGFYGDFQNFILPGFLIWINTFAGPILFSLSTPLLLFWPALSAMLTNAMLASKASQNSESNTWQGDFALFNNAIALRKNMFRISCGMMVVSTVKLLSAASAAALHRRHLMVWKIFAPRLVYEGALFITTSFCVLLAFLFVLRVDRKLSKFVKSLPSGAQKQ